ncbi:uncharacterized protein LOC124716966 isoform X2 [Schistocerca piceifrons]|uniref:uncharacterized protein LOC124716966 isoform X2 n=1 Tax=Schistocerca piceifrons TaxID=274613 RepID=UPI001F5F566F|nr:uncharacterized protein LOC124716966 isoform X2 [Schistocerca piceifrons]
MSRKECEDKWHNLKSQYSRELAKRKSSKGTGSATSNVYYSTWYAFESMQFIRDNYKPLSHRSTHEVVPVRISARTLHPRNSLATPLSSSSSPSTENSYSFQVDESSVDNNAVRASTHEVMVENDRLQ